MIIVRYWDHSFLTPSDDGHPPSFRRMCESSENPVKELLRWMLVEK